MARAGGYSGSTLRPFGGGGLSLDQLYAMNPSAGVTNTPGPPAAQPPPPTGIPAVTPPPVTTIPSVPDVFKPTPRDPVTRLFGDGFADAIQHAVDIFKPVAGDIGTTIGSLFPKPPAPPVTIQPVPPTGRPNPIGGFTGLLSGLLPKPPANG